MSSPVALDDYGKYATQSTSSRSPSPGKPFVTLVTALTASSSSTSVASFGEPSLPFDVLQLPPPKMSPTQLAEVLISF